MIFGIRVWSDIVLTGPLDVDQTGIAAHKVPHLVLHSYPNSSNNTNTGADVPHPKKKWVSSPQNLFFPKNIDTKLVGTALPRNIKKPCEVTLKHQTSGPFAQNHHLASWHFRVLARSKSSCAWATSRSMAPGGPWCGWSQNDLTPQMHQIYTKKCHFRSLLNDCWSAAQTSQTLKMCSLVERAVVQRVLVRFPRMFETAPWLEIENTSQNLEWCMGSKHLAIVNAVKMPFPPQWFNVFIFLIHAHHPYLSSDHPYSSHFVTIYPHLRAWNISDPNPLGFHRAGASQFHGSWHSQLTTIVI